LAPAISTHQLRARAQEVNKPDAGLSVVIVSIRTKSNLFTHLQPCN
jgi:hypothetical protein